jgi:hypothetical protein
MENVKYVCSDCGYEGKDSGSCPDCDAPLVATCVVCGNPVVGEQIQL